MNARFAATDARIERVLDQMRVQIAAVRADVIRWMFLFVATAVLVILGLG